MAAIVIKHSDDNYHQVHISFGSHVYEPTLMSDLRDEELQAFLQNYADNYEVEYNSMIQSQTAEEAARLAAEQAAIEAEG